VPASPLAQSRAIVALPTISDIIQGTLESVYGTNAFAQSKGAENMNSNVTDDTVMSRDASGNSLLADYGAQLIKRPPARRLSDASTVASATLGEFVTFDALVSPPLTPETTGDADEFVSATTHDQAMRIEIGRNLAKLYTATMEDWAMFQEMPEI
jgi:hypothetical protein